ncbi:hypothetical protein AYI68_g986 [Smittium mucronatum]|uniref:Uncharacterized protein n=1 Tax=Smittium mucronatum TaxID=133383 RepID=A0A1R0H6X7_9FUNG|nr:hypothetical protein AYI68_g986 [Smittium mucronatum]
MIKREINVRLPDGVQILLHPVSSSPMDEITASLAEILEIKEIDFDTKFKIQTLGGIDVLKDVSARDQFYDKLQNGFGELKLSMLVRGGKGGFGTSLKSIGSSNKTSKPKSNSEAVVPLLFGDDSIDSSDCSSESDISDHESSETAK